MHTVFSRFTRFVVVALWGILGAGAALADDPWAGETRWVCWYNNDMTVHCVLSQAAADSERAERAVKIANPVPGARPIPALARAIIRAPQEMVGLEVSIPMFNEPESHEFMEQLASFSVCYGKADCRMTFWHPVTVVAMAD